MSYPQQVPPGWERGEPVRSIGTGPRYAIGLDLSVLDPRALDPKGFMITFDSREDAEAWLKWWKQPAADAGSLCEDCPPVGYPTDKTRCDPCPRAKSGSGS